LPKASASACANTFGHEKVVVAAERVQGLREGDQVAGYELRSLVDQPVEGVLAVRATRELPLRGR
jgi:hypothetical protein